MHCLAFCINFMGLQLVDLQKLQAPGYKSLKEDFSEANYLCKVICTIIERKNNKQAKNQLNSKDFI